MGNPASFCTTTISVFTRHSSDCPKKGDRYCRPRDCRKSLFICENGKARFQPAKTRSSEQAERLAQIERELRDTVHVKLRKIREQEAEKIAAKKAKNITTAEACDRWIASRKFQTNETAVIYMRAARRNQSWAKDQGIGNLRGVTPDLLDEWRGQWSILAPAFSPRPAGSKTPRAPALKTVAAYMFIASLANRQFSTRAEAAAVCRDTRTRTRASQFGHLPAFRHPLSQSAHHNLLGRSSTISAV
jgi:hypothetical protein